MIRYKVVKPDRTSIFATNFYGLQYYRGSIVSKPDGTLGIFTFKRIIDAITFVENCFLSSIEYKIINSS